MSTAKQRHDGRAVDNLRAWSIETPSFGAAPGKVIVRAGETVVLCTASISDEVPPWMEGRGKGWVTAEYEMHPGAVAPRRRRDRSGKVDGRTTEIQRLIGRSLRAVVDLEALGERTVTVDCDVLQADGGTRTAAITGAWMALAAGLKTLPEFPDPLGSCLRDHLAAVSVGVVDGQAVLDLDYVEDYRAAVDMNVVMTGSGRFVELQGSGEEATFSDDDLSQLLGLARTGISQLVELQKAY